MIWCIERYKEGVEEMDWKECYDTGRSDNYFSSTSYGNPASLKTAYTIINENQLIIHY
jgi:hypothetical protein